MYYDEPCPKDNGVHDWVWYGSMTHECPKCLGRVYFLMLYELDQDRRCWYRMGILKPEVEYDKGSEFEEFDSRR